MPYKYLDDLVNNKRLALLNPEKWEDKNDSLAIRLYKEKMGIKHLLVACFTQTSETYHHWRIYGQDKGVRVVFNREALLKETGKKKKDGYLGEPINYIKLKDFKKEVSNLSQIPFIKRWPYRHEREFRIIWCGNRLKGDIKYLSLPEQAIEKIVISPWMSDETRGKIYNICGPRVEVRRTSILKNIGWLYNIRQLR